MRAALITSAVFAALIFFVPILDGNFVLRGASQWGAYVAVGLILAALQFGAGLLGLLYRDQPIVGVIVVSCIAFVVLLIIGMATEGILSEGNYRGAFR